MDRLIAPASPTLGTPSGYNQRGTMFERYDEPARRTLFFARYAASELGSSTIESEHLLLGLIRESRGRAARVLSALPLVEIRAELESRRASRLDVSTSVEIPFSAEAKRALGAAAEEADRLENRHIGTEHLLLGLLREQSSRAAEALASHGLRLEEARERVRTLSSQPLPRLESNAEVRSKIAEIMDLVNQLGVAFSRDQDAHMRVMLVLEDLRALMHMIDDAS